MTKSKPKPNLQPATRAIIDGWNKFSGDHNHGDWLREMHHRGKGLLDASEDPKKYGPGCLPEIRNVTGCSSQDQTVYLRVARTFTDDEIEKLCGRDLTAAKRFGKRKGVLTKTHLAEILKLRRKGQRQKLIEEILGHALTVEIVRSRVNQLLVASSLGVSPSQARKLTNPGVAGEKLNRAIDDYDDAVKPVMNQSVTRTLKKLQSSSQIEKALAEFEQAAARLTELSAVIQSHRAEVEKIVSLLHAKAESI